MGESKKLTTGSWMLLLSALLMVLVAPLPKANPTPYIGANSDPDGLLYKHVADRVGAGENYYSATVAEQRYHTFPLRPFISVRPPLFSYMVAFVPIRALGLSLLLACLIAWTRFRGLNPWERVAIGFAILFAGWHFYMLPLWMHELWAGAFLTLSLAVYRPDRWWLAVVLATLAVMIRELALPFLFLGAAFALYQRRWNELVGWAAGIAVFAAYMAFHAYMVSRYVSPTDLKNTSYGALVGYQYALGLIGRQSLLRLLPDAVLQLVVALSIVGWLGLKNRTGLFAFLFLTGMVVLFAVGAKFWNYYWGLILYPLWAVGLVFVPRFVKLVVSSLIAAGPTAGTQPTNLQP